MYIEAPNEWRGTEPSVFLAGGITDCPDWQAEARLQLENDVVVLNPRRENFPIDDPSAAMEQVTWEFKHLARARKILFWFASGPSPQPIALYELGRHAALHHPLVVGVDPNYVRRADVIIQLGLARPSLQIHKTLKETCEAVLNYKPR
jgi:hypothetical protein